MHETKTETLPLRHQQANENINNFYLKEMEANLIENNSSDLSLSPCEQKADGEVSPTPQNFAKLPCVFAEWDGGKFSGRKTWKADTKNPSKKQTKKEGKTNKKLST